MPPLKICIAILLGEYSCHCLRAISDLLAMFIKSVCILKYDSFSLIKEVDECANSNTEVSSNYTTSW